VTTLVLSTPDRADMVRSLTFALTPGQPYTLTAKGSDGSTVPWNGQSPLPDPLVNMFRAADALDRLRLVCRTTTGDLITETWDASGVRVERSMAPVVGMHTGYDLPG